MAQRYEVRSYKSLCLSGISSRNVQKLLERHFNNFAMSLWWIKMVFLNPDKEILRKVTLGFNLQLVLLETNIKYCSNFPSV